MVNIETEYKFLVNKIPKVFNNVYNITQSYFSLNDITKAEIKKIFTILNNDDFELINTYRIRMVSCNNKTKYIITLKTKGLNSRKEYEEEITKEQYDLFYKYSSKTIIKNRYVVEYNNYVFEFDEYFNLVENIITCEVETEIEDVNYNNITNIFKNYFHIEFQDVTNEKKYKNKYLQIKN